MLTIRVAGKHKCQRFVGSSSSDDNDANRRHHRSNRTASSSLLNTPYHPLLVLIFTTRPVRRAVIITYGWHRCNKDASEQPPTW